MKLRSLPSFAAITALCVNALPADEHADDSLGGGHQLWRRAPMVVCDGGPNFWGVEYDVAAKRFQNVGFNGPA
jgi:hypothetical protein